MPLFINEQGIIERITFDTPARVERHEYESSWLQKAIDTFWRMLTGYR
jgi:hypothetical protein